MNTSAMTVDQAEELLAERAEPEPEREVYRWVARPNRPYQQIGNEYALVPLTEDTYNRYIRPISGVDRPLAEYLRLWDERPEEVEGAKPTHVLLARTEQEPEMRAFRVGPLDYLRGYLEARERVGWFRRVDAPRCAKHSGPLAY